jgi:hypothetical protein
MDEEHRLDALYKKATTCKNRFGRPDPPTAHPTCQHSTHWGTARLATTCGIGFTLVFTSQHSPCASYGPSPSAHCSGGWSIQDAKATHTTCGNTCGSRLSHGGEQGHGTCSTTIYASRTVCHCLQRRGPSLSCTPCWGQRHGCSCLGGVGA